MRVIAGSARSLKLKTIDGMSTRPTTDRIKETLFNILNSNLQGCIFLDLFSGSGAIGIEALSRGAAKAFFVDNNRSCIKCIEDNLVFTRLKDKAFVMHTDVLSAIRKLQGIQGEPVDFIFLDPPYKSECEGEIFEELKKVDFIDEYTNIIIEASIDRDFSFVENDGFFEIFKKKIYKTNMHIFIRKK